WRRSTCTASSSTRRSCSSSTRPGSAKALHRWRRGAPARPAATGVSRRGSAQQGPSAIEPPRLQVVLADADEEALHAVAETESGVGGHLEEQPPAPCLCFVVATRVEVDDRVVG